jgi:hypothetical protein
MSDMAEPYLGANPSVTHWKTALRDSSTIAQAPILKTCYSLPSTGIAYALIRVIDVETTDTDVSADLYLVKTQRRFTPAARGSPRGRHQPKPLTYHYSQ